MMVMNVKGLVEDYKMMTFVVKKELEELVATPDLKSDVMLAVWLSVGHQ